MSRHNAEMIELSEQQIIDELAGRLGEIYREVGPDHVSRVVHEEYVRFEGSRIRDFVPLLVERHAKVELAKLGG